MSYISCCLFFFFNDTATTEIYTLSLHDALPISWFMSVSSATVGRPAPRAVATRRSEEHTSELQSLAYLVCRLLLEKKNIQNKRSFVDNISASNARPSAESAQT